MHDNKDIDSLIAELNHVKANVGNAGLLKRFISKRSSELLDFLNELKKKRDEIKSDQLAFLKKSAHRVVVEGYSDKNVHEAFSDALEKVTPYFSEHHDVSVTVLGLLDLPISGYRATLEVHVTPIKSRLSENLESPEGELKRLYDNNTQKFQSKEERYLQHLVQNHFLTTSGLLSYIPDHFLMHVHDASTLNAMIEEQFHHVANNDTLHTEHHHTPKVIVRVLEPDKSTASE